MNELVEIWKPVMGYEGLYEVSNLGRVRSLDRKVNHKESGFYQTIKGKIKSTKLNNSGYEIVSLFKNNKEKTCLVHRLVAQAFLPNPDNLPEVNHINEDKTANSVYNLEWCNSSYNKIYGTRGKRQGEKESVSVIQLTFDGCLVKRWSSMQEVMTQLGINRGNISNACSGRSKSAGGYKWKYYDTDTYLIAKMIRTIKDREKRKVA